MEATIRTAIDDIRSADADRRYHAFILLQRITDAPVDWAYEVWDVLLALTKDKNNHIRAISTQLLCNLAKSDPKNRMVADFDTVMAVTRDKMFVTARHTLQALWKVAAVGGKQRPLVLGRLTDWYGACVSHKNCTLIRYDIIVSLRALYDALTQDAAVKRLALDLIETEPDLKYRKKYAGVWRKSA